jgi:ketosteroid isomerase-like protein
MLPVVADELGWVATALIGVGGVLYTVGAVIYARRRPDPLPAVFGYHEVFHALTIGAAALHYAVIAFWVLPLAARARKRYEVGVSGANVELVRALLPDPGADLAELIRDEDRFAAALDAVVGMFDPAVESVPAWRGAGATYTGIDGFREMWLDWLEPWSSYHVQVDEMIELEDSVVVLVRDRGLRHGMNAEVELISGSLWTFNDGKVVRVEFYANREELREAVGLDSG